MTKFCPSGKHTSYLQPSQLCLDSSENYECFKYKDPWATMAHGARVLPEMDGGKQNL
jgi:hypothetical protein